MKTTKIKRVKTLQAWLDQAICLYKETFGEIPTINQENSLRQQGE